MLVKDGYSENLKEIFHKGSHGAKEMQLKLPQKLFNCDDVKAYFDEYKKIVDSIFDMKMPKQKQEEKPGRITKNPRRSRINCGKYLG